MSDLRANNAIVQLVEFYSASLKEAVERERQLTELLKHRAALPREVALLVAATRAVLKAHNDQHGDSPIHNELEALASSLKEYDARLGGLEPNGYPARSG